MSGYDEQAVEYAEVDADLTDEQAREQAISLFPSEDAPTEVVIVGPCPRCRHTTRFVDPLDRLRAVTEVADVMTQPRQRVITVLCHCRSSHADPNDPQAAHEGCGAAYKLAVGWGG